MPLIEARGLTREYSHGRMTVPALRGVDLDVEAGEFTAVAGPSGSGKTTLLNLIGCLDRPTRGRLTIDGDDVAGYTPSMLAGLRREKIGFVFQTYNLVPVLTAYENVELPLVLLGRHTHSEIRDSVMSMLAEVGLAGLENRRPMDLSGGQQQRVAIARALVKQPRLVLADEPTANLDSENSEAILALMKTLNETKGATFLFSSHDPLVIGYARRLVQMRDGKIALDERR
ncbi:MAG TPA: ABC transporter ATP-binding protein [Bacillota bacterium]|nr:ABC transporter ATP-binding protein [Bacillota bacterium]HNY68238.1 ABC transporter ATP-binding protein [Bacillota bacterium]HOI36924.1 ABC transporter ATP-binding protein [Bacillota bacterium]HPU74993.1 ABC transporter ATP-binding protein [Bacillota bacterium]